MKKSIHIYLLTVSCYTVSAQQTNVNADSFFRKGLFEAAANLYKSDDISGSSNSQLGYLSLLKNNFHDAEILLKRATEMNSSDTLAKKLLAECYYRQDKFNDAIKLLDELGHHVKAAQLASFSNKTPYLVASKRNTTTIKFDVADPLPVITVYINNKPYYFILDTGGPELIIDDELAQQLSLQKFGTNEGEFAGGKKRKYEYAFLDNIKMGDFIISNLPVNILSTKKFSAAAGGLPVSGIIGTVFLYHFYTTINYKDGELILRQRDEKNRIQLYTKQSRAIPFWMAGDHFMVAWGNINGGDSSLFFLDTGLAGPGFTAPTSTLETAKVKFLGNAMEGEGGGGTVKVNPFIASEISFAGITAKNVVGVSGAFPPSLEYAYKFRIGGLISHSFFKGKKLSFDFKTMMLIIE